MPDRRGTLPLISEPVPVFETFMTGIADIDDCGDFMRIICTVDRPLVGTAETERAVVARLIVPAQCYVGIVEALLGARLPAEPREALRA